MHKLAAAATAWSRTVNAARLESQSASTAGDALPEAAAGAAGRPVAGCRSTAASFCSQHCERRRRGTARTRNGAAARPGQARHRRAGRLMVVHGPTRALGL